MTRRAKRGEARALIEATVAHPPDDCVVWPFSLDRHGYGQVGQPNRKIRGAHIVALELFTGEAADGRQAAHAPVVCHNRACINPRHLRWATRQENEADKLLDGVVNTGVRHGMAKLTDDAVRSIRSDPRPYPDIAADHNISRTTVSVVKTRKRWAHVA